MAELLAHPSRIIKGACEQEGTFDHREHVVGQPGEIDADIERVAAASASKASTAVTTSASNGRRRWHRRRAAERVRIRGHPVGELTPTPGGSGVSGLERVVALTFDHPDLTTLTDAEVWDQLRRAEQVIEAHTGASPLPLFRFPYGA